MHSGIIAYDGVNVILTFLNETQLVDHNMDMEAQIRCVQAQGRYYIHDIELEEGWHKSLSIPMLVKDTDDVWIAVIPYSSGKCVFVKNGRRKCIRTENIGQFTNKAKVFYKCFGSGRIDGKRLLGFLFGSSSMRDRVQVVLCATVAMLTGMLFPLVNKYIFGKVIPSGEPFGVTAAAALIFSAIMVMSVLKIVQSFVLTNSMIRVSAYMQNAIFQRIFQLDLPFFRKIESGKLTQFVVEAADITSLITAKSIASCIGVVLSFVYLVQIYIYSRQMLPWVILITLMFVVLFIIEGKENTKWSDEYAKPLAEMSGFIYQIFAGMEQVKLNGAETRIIKKWSEKYLKASTKENKPFFFKYAMLLYKAMGIVFTIVIYILGAKMAAADYIAFSVAYGAYMAAFMCLPEVIRTISHFCSLVATISPVLDEDCASDEEKVHLKEIKGEITLEDVSFRYHEGMPYVLDHLSLQIKQGESIGIVGKSGCGKSTLVRLILGFERLTEGNIYIDRFDIRELDLPCIRRRFGTVLQEAGIISGDIYSNIAVTKPDATLEEVHEAMEQAGLAEEVANMPMGIRTLVSNENCTLSGGQKQRILIARAMIHKPTVLIFDEATSALDNISQAKITESMNKLTCTKIIVAHRLSTIEKCDKILLMNGGKIIAQGTFEEIKEHALLDKLMKRQVAN